MNVHDTFFAYWSELEQHTGWIDLGMGMPPVSLFPPALDVQTALIQGLNHRADYQPQAGPPHIRRAIAEYETKHRGIQYTPDNIMLVAGACRGFSLVIDHLISSTSSLVEIAPTYPLLSGHARYAAKKFNSKISTIIPKDKTNFLVQKDEILSYIHNSTILYFTNPSNPVGTYMPNQVLQDIIFACERSQSYVVIDETCDIPLNTHKIQYPKEHSPALIRVQSFSKNLLLAGFRAGYIVADSVLIRKLSNRYSFSDANAPTIFHEALLRYLQRPEALLSIIDIARSKIGNSIDIMKRMPRVDHIIIPEACYYIFLKVDYHSSSWNLFKYLLDSGVNVVPGILFGIDDCEPWIRIGCAHDDDTLMTGLARLSDALASL